MTKLVKLLEQYIDIDLKQIVVSGARDKGGLSKVRVRPLMIKDHLKFQCVQTVREKELHHNYSKKEVCRYLTGLMESQFKQLQLEHQTVSASVLVSKKGKVTIRHRSQAMPTAGNRDLNHDRKKNYILEPGQKVDFLVDLGVMNQKGEIVHAKYDKFRQINRFLEYVQDILPRLPKEREVTIVDFGCGKSYLTFAMYYYLKVLNQYDVNIIGLDLKEDVIRHCNQLSQKYGYRKLHFYVGDIASYQGGGQVDMVVTLHACDTATDYALAKAVKWGAKVILSVPCCQHELCGQLYHEGLEPVLSYGIIKERMAALVTDGLRASLLECAGYETQILEFIDMEHTPKNLLIRAVKSDQKKGDYQKVKACMEMLHLSPALDTLLWKQEN